MLQQNFCVWCGVVHPEGCFEYRRALVRDLERDPREPDGPGTFLGHVRRRLRFEEDMNAGRLSFDESSQIAEALKAEALALFRHGTN
jgi:hypothetical protein